MTDSGPDTAPEATTPYRAGFVSFVGRPNVGKSTLTNALVGQKVAITSSKPQTTRRAIRGIVHRPHGQVIVVDTPGVHRPRTLLGERLNDLVQSTLGDVDVIGFCVPANEPIGPGDRFINDTLDQYPRAKKIAIVTKIDRSGKEKIAEQLLAVSRLREWDAIIPTSGTEGLQLEDLIDEVVSLLPESPQLYDDLAVTEETDEERIGELIREAALEGVRDELPHSLAVVIEDMVEPDADDDPNGPLRIFANLFVERDSQKSIVIGHKGGRLKDVGTRARVEIEGLLGRHVYLNIRVKVAKEWQRDPKQLGRLGF
ncbi:GTP-binding protein Era [Curtobacterium herbarum]|jgi:GTP-binding protein Era|uniref:GTPase Era n=1 Tax=Curtobacterium salicis TaxID=1779862 RepID=A0ABX0T883_9MICO|nr:MULTISPECIES: GTPase Era [Curtobacterium]MCP1501717.1 GTP-binding protein Era [Curtobacterium herbarum]MDN4646670.1 GTPase Era [Curtobacterium sp. PsM8]MDY1005940.1 GTPase Era [Curtobacterium sp. CFBP9011]NII40069.1 GTP-binding protein Era [Curtobacterium sp. WW7]WIE62930.1 GTPase Era [Curtobacterium sp. MCLR17_032]